MGRRWMMLEGICVFCMRQGSKYYINYTVHIFHIRRELGIWQKGGEEWEKTVKVDRVILI